jgi:hypothetical protein
VDQGQLLLLGFAEVGHAVLQAAGVATDQSDGDAQLMRQRIRNGALGRLGAAG